MFDMGSIEKIYCVIRFCYVHFYVYYVLYFRHDWECDSFRKSMCVSTSMGKSIVVDRMYPSSYVLLIGQDLQADMLISVMIYLILFGIVKVYYYLHDLAYDNLQNNFREYLQLFDNVVKGYAFQSVSLVEGLLDLVLNWLDKFDSPLIST